MPWIYRDDDNNISGSSRWENYPDQEFLAEDSAEWIAYLGTCDTDEQRKAIGAERDLALNSMVHDFGDGRIIQTRPSDISNVKEAINIGSDRKWIMSDNTISLVTIAELQAAYATAVTKGEAIWDKCITDIENLNQ